MAFKFPLATVLRYRESIEQQEERALMSILAEMEAARQRIENLTADIANARQSLNQAMQEMLPAIHIEYASGQIRGAEDRKKELLQSLAELDRKREAQTAKYKAAHQSRKMLGEMQARQREAYEQERVRLDQKLLDDIFSSRAQRSQ